MGDDMNLIISRTTKGTKEYPFHKHSDYEISFCLDCEGVLRVDGKSYPFSTGNIIIVPPGTFHSSISEVALDCIYVRGDFSLLFDTNEPVILRDNTNGDGRKLAMLIYDNRFSNREYLLSLCDAYIHFIITNMKFEDTIGQAVNEIVQKITQNCFDPYIDIASFLKESGYAEDYIRSHFKKITGKTPIAFLTDIRIRHACFLAQTYGTTLTLSEIAERCGYTDYVYFSKKFKTVTGISPATYRERL